MRALKNICQWPRSNSQIYPDSFTKSEILHPNVQLTPSEQNIIAETGVIAHEYVSHINYYQTIFKLVWDDQELVIWRNNIELDRQVLPLEFDLYQSHNIPHLGYITITEFGTILDPSLIGRSLFGCDYRSTHLPPAAQLKCRDYIFGRLIAPDPY